MSSVLQVEVKKDDGDASFMMGLVLGIVLGAALAVVLTSRADDAFPTADPAQLPSGVLDGTESPPPRVEP